VPPNSSWRTTASSFEGCVELNDDGGRLSNDVASPMSTGRLKECEGNVLKELNGRMIETSLMGIGVQMG
jgi:hypothetical protein